LFLLPVKQTSLDLTTEVVRVVETGVGMRAGFPNECLHAFRAVRFRSQFLDKNQRITAYLDGVVKLLFRG
jgi:hypothetical protein